MSMLMAALCAIVSAWFICGAVYSVLAIKDTKVLGRVRPTFRVTEMNNAFPRPYAKEVIGVGLMGAMFGPFALLTKHRLARQWFKSDEKIRGLQHRSRGRVRALREWMHSVTRRPEVVLTA